MNTLVELAELKVLYRSQEKISNDLILMVTEPFENKIYKLFSLIKDNTLCETEEEYNNKYLYLLDFINQISELFGNILNDEQKKLCVAYLIPMINNKNGSKIFYDQFNHLKNIEVGENQWLWLIRELVRYRLLSCLNHPLLQATIPQLQEYIDLLKPNKEQFNHLSKELEK